MKKMLTVLGVLGIGAAFAANVPDSQWKGKRVAFLGDSITDKSHVRCSTNYWGFLDAMLGIQPLVYGINGHQMSRIKAQAEQLRAEHGEDVDAIFIFAGTNDYFADTPLGKWWDYTLEPSNWRLSKELAPKRMPAMDEGTFRGRINIALDYIKDHFPDAQVILLTPLHRGYAYFSGNNSQSPECFGNPRGLHIDDYVEVIKEAGDIWSVLVINLYGISGLYPMKDSYVKCFGDAKNDRLHPNTEGHRRIAETIKYQILAMPSTFRK